VPLNLKKGSMRNPLRRVHRYRGLVQIVTRGFLREKITKVSLAWVYTYHETAVSGQLAKNASWMFLGQGVSFVVQAGYFILLARLLGADRYGIFVGAAAAVSLLSQYSMLGSGMVLLRQVSRHNSEFCAPGVTGARLKDVTLTLTGYRR
jgi:hypothetical protein